VKVDSFSRQTLVCASEPGRQTTHVCLNESESESRHVRTRSAAVRQERPHRQTYQNLRKCMTFISLAHDIHHLCSTAYSTLTIVTTSRMHNVHTSEKPSFPPQTLTQPPPAAPLKLQSPFFSSRTVFLVRYQPFGTKSSTRLAKLHSSSANHRTSVPQIVSGDHDSLERHQAKLSVDHGLLLPSPSQLQDCR
jgi:hypothetical protein